MEELSVGFCETLIELTDKISRENPISPWNTNSPNFRMAIMKEIMDESNMDRFTVDESELPKETYKYSDPYNKLTKLGHQIYKLSSSDIRLQTSDTNPYEVKIYFTKDLFHYIGFDRVLKFCIDRKNQFITFDE